MTEYLTLPLIGLGALIMLFSVWETRRIFRLLEGNRYRRVWRILQFMMGFFVVGYAGMATLILHEQSDWIVLLTGVVFFGGALFVFLVVHSGLLTMVELVASKSATDRARNAREVAEASDRAKSDFLAMMSHEIRTPMNGVIGFAHLLADTKLDDQQRDHVRTIITSGDSLLAIINDILDFSKLDAAKVDLEHRPVAIRHVIEDVLDLLASKAHAKGLEILYWMAPNVPEGIVGDETRLRQILLNLGTNAVKFTASGSIEFLVELADDDQSSNVPFPLPPDSAGAGQPQITFRVRDTGEGIPADKLERLFKPFTQVDVSVTRTHGGTGLGLAICRRLVELMDGAIEVTSEPGRGSDFHFTLPVEKTDVADQINERVAVPTIEIDRVLAGRRVLVVDDSEPNRRLCKRLLHLRGAEVVAVESAAAALRVLENQKFDIALLDYVMPEMDGVRLAQKIRTLPHQPCPHLMLVTSMTMSAESVPEGLFDMMTTKPVRNMQLLMLVARTLTGHVRGQDPVEPKKTKARLADQFPMEILVVEDNPVNVKLITQILRANGYVPTTAENGEIALILLRERRFDLVLMDMLMPVLDGVGTTEQLRAGAAGETNRSTRVYALTANASLEDQEKCREAGMNGFLSKPIRIADLVGALRKVGEQVTGSSVD